MQKSLAELLSLPQPELSDLIDHLAEPLLVTREGEPQFVAQSLPLFESMVRRLRVLEEERQHKARHRMTTRKEGATKRGMVIPFRTNPTR